MTFNFNIDNFCFVNGIEICYQNEKLFTVRISKCAVIFRENGKNENKSVIRDDKINITGFMDIWTKSKTQRKKNV